MAESRIDSIKRHLAHAPSFLASLYTPEMEVQVNVSPKGGKRVQKEYKGRKYWAFTDGNETWKSFRIPWADGTFKDRPLSWTFEKYVEAIGLTGWNWALRKTMWVGYDFDSIIGHKEGLTDDELREVLDSITGIDWVTAVQSRGGKGFHLYVHFEEPVTTESRQEHMALARAILSHICALSGQDLKQQVDKLGQVLWIWHEKVAPNGLQMLKKGGKLDKVPVNWRDHVQVATKKKKRSKTKGDDDIDDLVNKLSRVPLDEDHRRLLGWLAENGGTWHWDSDRHMLVVHTHDLKRAHDELRLKGVFYTLASGKDWPADQNAFAFPIGNGAWCVRRHGQGTREHPAWTRDSSGWTRCFYNQVADLYVAAVTHGGIEDSKGRFNFHTLEQLQRTVRDLGADDFTAPDVTDRPASLYPHKKDPNRIVCEMERLDGDKPPAGWFGNKRKWEIVVNIIREDEVVEPPDEILMHLVSANLDAGWWLRSNKSWICEPKGNVVSALTSLNYGRNDIENMLGQCVLNHWTLVNKPFEAQFPGNREWNRDAAQLKITPAQGQCPTWQIILEHSGKGLDSAVQADPWCRKYGLETGADYLRCWIAAMFQYPYKRLPYLFFWGPQNSGKSTLHESIGEYLLTKGYVKAKGALTEKYNDQLAGAILCVVEEFNLRSYKDSYDTLKEATMGKTLSVRAMFQTPYMIDNTTHWVHCANKLHYCPIDEDDTRITVCYVDKPETEIPRDELDPRLEAEAPAFLHQVMSLELPPPMTRTRIPVLSTQDKHDQALSSKSELDIFIEEECHVCEGEAVRQDLFYRMFLEWLPDSQKPKWSRSRMTRELPRKYPRGRYSGTGHIHIGNLSFDQDASPSKTLKLVGDRLIK